MSAAPTFPLATRLRLAIYLVALLSIAAFSNTDASLSLLFLGVVASMGAWLLVDSPRSQARLGLLPPGSAASKPAGDLLTSALPYVITLLPNIAVLIAALRLAWHVYQFLVGSQSLILGLSSFIVVLILCKLFEPKNLRNVAQILILSLLLVVSATMFSNSGLFYFFLLGIYFIFLVYTVVLLNLATETDRIARHPVPAFIPQSPSGAVLPGSRSPHSPSSHPQSLVTLLTRDLGMVAKHCLFLVLPVAAVVFLMVPRTRGNLSLSSSLGGGSFQTGFTETVQFRDFGQLSQSDAEVMRVQLTRGSENVSGEFSDLYFRGQVLNDYDPVRAVWTHGAYKSDSPPAEPLFPPHVNIEPVIVTYTLLVPGRNLFLLTPSTPIAPRGERMNYIPADMTLQDTMSQSRSVGGTFTYTAIWDDNLPYMPEVSHVTPGVLGPPPRYGRMFSAQTQTRPQTQTQPQPVMVDNRITELARSLLASGMGADAPAPGQVIPDEKIHQVVSIFENYLRSNFRYSLSFRQVDDKIDPSTDFLLNRGIKQKDIGGHCEYFASAMVMLARSVGLNCRMVTGFHGGEFNTVTGEFLIRQKYAHAWTEVYIPEEGWVISDPSPIGSNIDTTASSGHFFMDMAQILQSLWSALVINFDNDSRAAIARWFSSWMNQLMELPPLPAWTTLCLSAAVLFLLVLSFQLRRHFRRLQPLLESTRGLPHRQIRLATHVNFLEDLLHFFERTTLRRPDQTPLEFLEPHFATLGPGVAADARWLIRIAYGIRFGSQHLDAEAKHEIARALKNVKAALRARAELKH